MFAITPQHKRDAAIIASLVAVTFAVFIQVRDFEFLNYDDNVYITENPDVLRGFGIDSFITAFTKPQNAGYTPIVTVTHMIDVDLFGLDAGPPHLIDVLFHALTSVMLFVVLRDLTGAVWPAAFAAALFALHPLHVEPVAWISSRKDLVSTNMMLATIRSYVRYVRRDKAFLFFFVVFQFTQSLLAKPMTITLPFVLLLLDYWPLRRYTERPWTRLAIEKIPLFLMSLAISIVTFLVQRAGGAVRSIEEFTLGERLTNALVAYAAYLVDTVWPAGLAPYYPYPAGGWALWQIAGSVVLLAAITALCLARRNKNPYLLIGWCWYLGTLVPVCGLVQIGSFARADRFYYLPSIGLFIMVAWTLAEIAQRRRIPRPVLIAGAALILAPLAVASAMQTAHWRNSITIFEHTLKVTKDNPVAHNNLGVALLQKARTASPDSRDALLADAQSHLAEAVRIAPNYVDARNNYGLVLNALHDPAASEQFEAALAIDPDNAQARVNLGTEKLLAGDPAAAIELYRQALERNPDSYDAHYNLGVALGQLGQTDDAVTHYRAVLALNPRHAPANINLANALVASGLYTEAKVHAEEAVRLAPDNPEAHYNLGLVHFFEQRPQEAETEFRKALELNPDYAAAHMNLAVVLANSGNIADAIRQTREALAIEPDNEQAQQLLKALTPKSGH